MKKEHLMQNNEKDKLMVHLLQNKNNAIFYINYLSLAKLYSKLV